MLEFIFAALGDDLRVVQTQSPFKEACMVVAFAGTTSIEPLYHHVTVHWRYPWIVVTLKVA